MPEVFTPADTIHPYDLYLLLKELADAGLGS